MFGLDLWFVYSVLSALSGGLYIFTHKVAVERGYEGVLFNTASSVISAAVLITMTGFFAGYELLTWIALLFVVINGTTYMIGNVVRYETLKCIDTAIFYPLYKTFAPVLAIMVGVLFLSETFSASEWYGIALSLLVPLLLLSKKEDERQKNLKRGLILLLVASLLAAIAATALKLGTNVTDNEWMFASVTHVTLLFVGLGIMLRKQSVPEIIAGSTILKNAQYQWLLNFSGFMHAAAFIFFVLALNAGTLSLVYTIQSLYILIPIVLSIIFYNEHWNLRKVIAIVLSIVALWFLQ